MKTELNTNRCPKCQAPLPPNAPQGLCPKCLLAAASTPTEAGQPAHKNPPPPLQEVAAAFPQLQVLELIGQGGMGVVYKARQPRLDRLVALKLLPQSLAADPAFAERFNREARVLARLNHPNIVTVYDFGQSGGFFYLLMEFVDGVNLRQAMQAGRFTPQQAMMLVPRICEALQFAHDEGILHRDIKPENILLDTRGRVKIADFGIAKLLGEAQEKITLTGSGQAIGTPHYMAPEQLEHPQDVDQRADIYSLGVVFYEMLTGELPIGRFAAPSTKSTVDPRVDDVVFHALEKEREKRFRSATEVKTSVEAITGHPSACPPPPVPQAPALHATCYFNTPSRMRDCFPSAAARIFTCKGELALDAQNLTFTNSWRNTITIPLKDIENLSVGQFQMWTTPWMVKYARINFLSVTFRCDGQSQTVHLTPAEAGAMSAGQINDCVGRWFERVGQAAQQCTGTAPHASDTASMIVSAEPAWNRKCLFLIIGCLLIGLVTLALDQFGFSCPPWLLALSAAALLLLGLSAVTFMRANNNVWHGQLDAVTSDDPPRPEPAQAPPSAGQAHRQAARWARTSVATTSMAILAIILLLISLSHGNSRKHLSRSGAQREPATATVAATPESEAQFVLYSLPVEGTNRPGELRWTFKYLVPAHHLARVLFIFWTNGVPKVDKGFSAYYKVGNTSLDEELWLYCERNAPSASPDVPNVKWNRYVARELKTGSMYFQHEPAYRRLDTPAKMTVRAGHQAILRLVDYVLPEGQPIQGQSGIELRIFLEPMKYAPVRTDPFEKEGNNFVSGTGSGWTEDEALKAIKEWPAEPQQTLGPKPAPAQPASATLTGKAGKDFVLYTMPNQPAHGTNTPSGRRDWNFKCLLPAHHLTRVLLVLWKDGVPQVQTNLSAYFKVGNASVDQEFHVSRKVLVNTAAAGRPRDVQWNVSLLSTRSSRYPGSSTWRPLEPPAHMTVGSGHQGILRLVDYPGSDGHFNGVQSGAELRIFTEPITYTPVRTSSFEFEGTNYVAGYGAGWTTDQALQAIKQWPVDN